MSICPWIVLVLIGTSISVAGENLSCTGAALPPLLLIPGCLLIAALVPGSASGGIRHPGTGFRRRPKRRAVI